MLLEFTPPNTEILSLKDISSGKVIWERAVAVSSAKVARALFRPTRITGGDDTTYPAFPPSQVMPSAKAFGKNLTHKPGIYPYGSTTGNTPITSTSLKTGTYKSAKIKGKAVTKRKRPVLWGRYVPCDGITNGASTSIDTGIKAQDNIELFCRVTAITGSFYLLQSRQTTSTLNYGLSGGQARNDINAFGMTSTITRTAGHIYTIKATVINREGTLYVKDETAGTEDTQTGTVTSSAYPFPSPTTIKLFGDASMLAAGVTVYRAYIKVNGQMAWDMYPAVDVTDSNAPVAYDDVAHAASEKLSGSITAGSLIQPISYVDLNDKYVAIGHNTNVGSTYKQEVEFMISELDTEKFTSICGADNGLFLGVTTAGKFAPHNLTSTAINIPVSVGVWHTVVDTVVTNLTVGNVTGTFDGVEYNDKRSSFNSSLWYIGGLAGVSYGRKVKIRKYRVWKDDKLIYDFSSAKIGSNSGFLNDLDGTIYNATGFQYGADIPYTQLCPDILETNVGDAEWNAPVYTPFDSGSYTAGSQETCCCVDVSVPNGTYTVKTNVIDTVNPAVATAFAMNGHFTSSFTTSGQGVFPNAPRTVTVTGGVLSIAVRTISAGGYKVYTTKTQYDADGCWIKIYDNNNKELGVGLHPSGSQKVLMGEQGVVDLGTLIWAYHTERKLFMASPSGVIHTTPSADTKLYIEGYQYRNPYTIWNNPNNYDMSTSTNEGTSSTAGIFVRDFRFTDAASFKSAMSGKYLFYQRSTDASFIPPQSRTITTFLPSANSFVDAQKASNNAECDWKFVVADGTTVKVLTTKQGNVWIVNATGKVSGKTEIICSHFPYSDGSSSTVPNHTCMSFTSYQFGFRADEFSTAEEVNAWLAEQEAKNAPIIFGIPLATPEVTTVTLSELTQPLGTVTILNEFADGTKGAVDFYGVNINIANPVPKPDEPYPLLSNVGEVSYGQYGSNLFDPNNAFSGQTFVASGITFTKQTDGGILCQGTATSQAYTTPFEMYDELEVGKTYVVSTNLNKAVPTMQYTRNDVRKYATKLTLEEDMTSVKVYFYFASGTTVNDVVYFQLEEGSTATPYEPYHFGWHGDGQQTVKMESVNLWNLGDFINGVGTQKTLEGLDPNKTYTVLVKASADYSTDSTAWSVSPRNSDGSSRGNLFYMHNYVAGQTVSVEFTGAAMLRVQGTNFTGSFYICVVEGSATEFSPYVVPQTRTTSEILPSQNSYLDFAGGADNEECDWEFKVLDGVTAGAKFNGVSPLSTFYFSSVIQTGMTRAMPILCTHFKNQNVVANYVCYAGTGVITFHHSFSTLAEANAWLVSEYAAGHPVILAYPKATVDKKTILTTPFQVPVKTTYAMSTTFADGTSGNVQVTCLGKGE